MKKKIYILSLVLLSFNISCDDDFLDTTPYDGFSNTMIFASDENATMAMNGVYNALARYAFYTDFYNYITNLGPEGFEQGRAAWGLTLSAGLATAREGGILNNYRNFYRPIIYANDVIAGLEGNENVSEALREKLIGEAKFARGICYFYLLQLFGGVVILDQPMPVSETYLPRNTAEEVKNFIIDDFTDAIERLPVASNEVGRVTKGAAIAMLGKTYLFDEQWDLAVDQFEILLSSPYTYDLMADYADNFNINTENNEESVFELQYVEQEGLGSSFDRWYGNRSNVIGGGDRANMTSHSLYAFTNRDGSAIDFSTMPKVSDYPDDVAHGIDLIAWYEETFADVDFRLHKSAILPGATYVGAGGVTSKLYWPYQNYVNADPPALRTTFSDIAKILIRKLLTVGDEHTLFREDSPMNYALIRFSDVLLMYAEALNEVNGAVPEVYTAVNRVRERAGLVGLPEGLSQTQMRREIWLERYRELMFEGHLYFDVRRWRVAHTNDPIFGLNYDVIDYRFETVFYTKVFNETRDYLWPIPENEIDLNPLMSQNPEW
jgi:starch-binding outer membrane protein, SusD/RagB family